MEQQIKLDEKSAQEFVSAASKCNFDIDVFYNRIIIDAKLSKQIVNCGETFSISVSIISNDYLSLYKHSELKSYTHSQLKEGDGVIGR